MDRDQVARVVAAERLSLADLLATLSAEEWERPSLCVGWRVRDVAAHLSLGTRVGVITGAIELARARGRVNTLIHDSAVRRAGAVEPAQLVADLRAAAASRRHPMGTSYLNPLADVLVHGQDIAVPLGRHREMPLDAAAVAATRDWTMGFPFHARRRLAGLRLAATDVDWAVGDGPIVEGPIAALLLVITGRPAGVSRLGGAGAAELAARLAQPRSPTGATEGDARWP